MVKIGVFSTNISLYIENGKRYVHGIVSDLLNGAIFNDLERPITQILRSRQYSTLNISVTVEDRYIFTMCHVYCVE